MATVELVLLVESPGAVSRACSGSGARGTQSGRRLAVSSSRNIAGIFSKPRSSRRHAKGRSSRSRSATSPDVLAQQIVAVVAEGPLGVDELKRCSRGRRATRRCLSVFSNRCWTCCRAATVGRLRGLRPRLHWDREPISSRSRGQGGSRCSRGGRFPIAVDAVHVGPDGPRIGSSTKRWCTDEARRRRDARRFELADPGDRGIA